MSVDSASSAPKWQAYCPDCGGKFLNIWIGGRVHCGNCSKGGVIWSPHYEHLLNLERPSGGRCYPKRRRRRKVKPDCWPFRRCDLAELKSLTLSGGKGKGKPKEGKR